MFDIAVKTNNILLRTVDSNAIKIPVNIILADNAYNQPWQVDMLKEAELFYD